MSVPYRQLDKATKARVDALDPTATGAPKDRAHRKEIDDGGHLLCVECGAIYTGVRKAERHVNREHGGGTIRFIDNKAGT